MAFDYPSQPSSPVPPAPAPPPSGPPAPVVAGFRLLQQLSLSSDGELWLAQHTQSGVTVGLAFLAQAYSMSRSSVPRMREELITRMQQPIRLLVINPPVDSEYINNPALGGASNASKKSSGCVTALIVCLCLMVLAVPVIALLATIAVPSFLRARHRSQATKIVNDARIYEAAIDQWAIENNKESSSPVTFHEVSDYMLSSTELVKNQGHDILGNEYVIGTVFDGVKVNQASYDQLSDVTRPDFWSSYAPPGVSGSYSPAP